ncbi:MAG TPA: nucleoside-diphosphate-sugar epimerase, partial [bacterium]|nr:nucleoside-diphosphate-sugar epimerase [bacterium]
GRAITVAEMASRVAQKLGVSLAPEISGRYRPGDVRHCTADISAIRAAYGFAPRVAYEDGLTELIAWSRTQKPHAATQAALDELAKRGLSRAVAGAEKK